MRSNAIFSTGEVIISDGARNAAQQNLQLLSAFVGLHAAGVWGDVTPRQHAINQKALYKRGWLRSTFFLRDGKRLSIQTGPGHRTTIVRLAGER